METLQSENPAPQNAPNDSETSGDTQTQGEAPTVLEAQSGKRKGHQLTNEDRQKAVAVRRAKAEAEALAAGGFRAKLRSSIDRMTQGDVDRLVKTAKPAELVRLADQALGRPSEGEGDKPKPIEAVVSAMSEAQRTALRQWINAQEGGQAEPEGGH